MSTQMLCLILALLVLMIAGIVVLIVVFFKVDPIAATAITLALVGIGYISAGGLKR